MDGILEAKVLKSSKLYAVVEWNIRAESDT
jgi:hypothetical protein